MERDWVERTAVAMVVPMVAPMVHALVAHLADLTAVRSVDYLAVWKAAY